MALTARFPITAPCCAACTVSRSSCTTSDAGLDEQIAVRASLDPMSRSTASVGDGCCA